MITATANFINALSTFRKGQILLLIEITGYARKFVNYASGIGGQYPWIVSVEDLSTSVNDLDGGAEQTTFTFNILDKAGAITGDFPGFVFEGKLITLKVGLPGLAQADFATVFTGYVNTVQSTNANQEYVFTCGDISNKLSQMIYLLGDNGLPIDGDNPKTLNAHPLDILLDILSVKIGLAGAYIDTTKIQAYRDGPLSGTQFQFRLDQSVSAIDFIKQQLLKPLGGYLWVNGAGVVTVNFFYPLAAPASVFTLTPSYWLDIPDAEQVDMINTVQFQFDKDDGTGDASGNYLAQDTELYSPSVTKYGQYGEVTIAADGLRSGLQGFFLCHIVARMIFMRYGMKNLKFDENAPESIWQACRLEPGDISCCNSLPYSQSRGRDDRRDRATVRDS
jgi:hypothetical protein